MEKINRCTATTVSIRRSVLALCVFASALPAFAQNTAVVLSPGTTVTGKCAGQESAPGCVLPNLFGPQGLSLFPSAAFPHYAHFIGSAQETINQTLSTAIATQLTAQPFVSPASGFTYTFDKDLGIFQRTSNSFGPVYSERADTIGRGKMSFGVAYQRYRFGHLDGLNLHDIPAAFSHVPNTFNGGPLPYEADIIKTSNRIDIKMDQTLFFQTVGITDRIDVSVAIPVNTVSVSAVSSADIIRVSGPTFTVGTAVIPNPHSFTSDPNSLHNTYTSSGTATGIGDITLRVKGSVWQRENYRVALALDARIPSGDAQKFLGSGATGLRPTLIVSAGKRFSPHANFSYQWNGKSVLAGNLTGVTVGENTAGQATILNGPVVAQNMPRAVIYTAGAEYGVTPALTLAADYLGQTIFNAPGITPDTLIAQNIPGGTGPIPVATIKATTGMLYLNNASFGFKYNLFRDLLLTGNMIVKLDDHGLRQNITPLISLSYAFGR